MLRQYNFEGVSITNQSTVCTFIGGLHVRLAADFEVEPDVDLAQQVWGPTAVTSRIGRRQEAEVEDRALPVDLLGRVGDQLTLFQPFDPRVRTAERFACKLKYFKTFF